MLLRGSLLLDVSIQGRERVVVCHIEQLHDLRDVGRLVKLHHRVVNSFT